MEKKDVLAAITALKKDTKQRKFVQSYDLIIKLKDLDLKKNEEQVDFYAMLAKPRGTKTKVCAFVGPELKDEAIRVCDKVILQTEFAQYDKKKAKQLAGQFDYFIAQANLMGAVATTFGKILGPRNKMPNPKAGCVVPPKGSLEPLYNKLQQLLRVSAKVQPQVQCRIGKESCPDDDVAENILAVHNQLLSHLPGGENNVQRIYLKLTMGKPLKVF